MALARATYHASCHAGCLVVLDDVLCALDATVAERVFESCIRGLLADRCVLL